MRFVSPGRQQSIHRDLPRLPNAMAPRHGLHVVLRVPVGIINDDRVARRPSRSVDADAAGQRVERSMTRTASGPCCANWSICFCELVSARDAAIDATVRVLCTPQVIRQDIQHHDELREYQNFPVAFLEQSRE